MGNLNKNNVLDYIKCKFEKEDVATALKRFVLGATATATVLASGCTKIADAPINNEVNNIDEISANAGTNHEHNYEHDEHNHDKNKYGLYWTDSFECECGDKYEEFGLAGNTFVKNEDGTWSAACDKCDYIDSEKFNENPWYNTEESETYVPSTCTERGYIEEVTSDGVKITEYLPLDPDNHDYREVHSHVYDKKYGWHYVNSTECADCGVKGEDEVFSTGWETGIIVNNNGTISYVCNDCGGTYATEVCDDPTGPWGTWEEVEELDR